MPSGEDNAAELAEELIRLLSAERSLGPSSYPLSVSHLIELAGGSARPAQIARAIAKKAFQARMVRARAKNQNAPIALASGLEAFAGNRLLLQFMIKSLRTASNQAFSAAQLKAKASRKLQRPLQAAIVQQMEHGSLPPSVGWIVINRTKKLFLLTDLHLGTQEPGTTALRSSVLSS